MKTFYKAAIGQLILCRDLELARKVVKAILLVPQFEFDWMINPRELEDQNEDLPSEESAPNCPEDESILDGEVNKDYSNF